MVWVLEQGTGNRVWFKAPPTLYIRTWAPGLKIPPIGDKTMVMSRFLLLGVGMRDWEGGFWDWGEGVGVLGQEKCVLI